MSIHNYASESFHGEIICFSCGKRAHATWRGVESVGICRHCAVNVLPKLMADAVASQVPLSLSVKEGYAVHQDVKNAFCAVQSNFWEALSVQMFHIASQERNKGILPISHRNAQFLLEDERFTPEMRAILDGGRFLDFDGNTLTLSYEDLCCFLRARDEFDIHGELRLKEVLQEIVGKPIQITAVHRPLIQSE